MAFEEHEWQSTVVVEWIACHFYSLVKCCSRKLPQKSLHVPAVLYSSIMMFDSSYTNTIMHVANSKTRPESQLPLHILYVVEIFLLLPGPAPNTYYML